MPERNTGEVRALVLVGPAGVGKTTLMEAMLAAAGESDRNIGDSSPEAKARGHSVELNLAGFGFLGDRYRVIDCPGSPEFEAEADAALALADLAVVVVEPDPERAPLVQPTLRRLEMLGLPRAIFVNRMDQARGPLDALLAALAPLSAAPLVARQLPIVEGEKVVGAVDLALEREYIWRPNKPSEVRPLSADHAAQEADARFHMLEALADFDDELMEQLLNDADPARDLVFADLVREMNLGQIVPVFFGSAINGFGVRRLLKALRHETPAPAAAAERLGLTAPAAVVLKTAWAGQAGKLAQARVFGAPLADGAELTTSEGARARTGGLYLTQGGAMTKAASAPVGEVVAIAKVEAARTGEALSLGRPQAALQTPPRAPLFALAVSASARRDDAKLSGALARIVEEDPGLSLRQDGASGQTLLTAQGEGHLRLALDRLKRRYGLEVTTGRPATAYRETPRATATQRGRHKKQTGGHGQFADVTLEIRPLARGDGFAFVSKITGGAVPRQWIPAVEQGVVDAMRRGPLGFPVEDLQATLLDGAFHSVDSSEMAFRTAGRIAAEAALRASGTRLLEPVDRLEILVPTSAISGVNGLLSARRGHILGFGPRDGWRGWERIEAFLPHSEIGDLVADLRSLSQGLGVFEARFDHLAELTGRAADDVVAATHAA